MTSGRPLSQLELVAEQKVRHLEDALAAPGGTPQDRVVGLDLLAEWHRVAACCRLLRHADVPGFRRGLRACAEARVAQLRLRASASLPFDRHTGAARYVPLCAAVAAGADELAREIVALSSPQHVPRQELEEDFEYAAVLHALVVTPAAPPLDPLARLQGVAGEDDPRFRVARALARRDAGGWRDAVQELITAWEDGWEAIPRMSRPETYQADRAVFVEGLALLRLAAGRGLPVDAEYPFMPALARVP